MRTLLDLMPILLFFGAYKLQDIYFATAVLMAATCLQMVVVYAMDRKLQTIHQVTLVLILVFGTLTLVLHDDRFIKWKPTVLYLAMALAVAKEQMDALTMQVVRSGRPVTPDLQSQIREEVIAREIFMQEAQKRGLDQTGDCKMQMELAREAILIRELFGEFQKANPVTDNDVKAEYDKFVAANSGKEYKARHILVEKEDEAKALIAQLKRGGKFEDIAKKSSKDPGSGANGGDLGWASAGKYVKEFSEAMVKLKKGQLTDAPVKSQFGFHVIRLDDERETQLPKFEEVKPQILQQLQQQKLARYQQELRGKAKVE